MSRWQIYEVTTDADGVDCYIKRGYIVRCKECKHRKKNGFCLEHNRYEKNDSGYCSYGEREGK